MTSLKCYCIIGTILKEKTKGQSHISKQMIKEFSRYYSLPLVLQGIQPCWSSWMSILKECKGDNPNLLFISDRHPAIALSVHNEFPLAFHVAYTPEEFTTNMNILQVVQPDAYNKLIQAGTQKWSRAHCPLIRYNYMTSNNVESVNACSVLKRKLPITMLTEPYRVMVQYWYFKRQELTDICI
ncbi:hypothetical protein Tco_0572316 [Tanacetum coccineum]